MNGLVARKCKTYDQNEFENNLRNHNVRSERQWG